MTSTLGICKPWRVRSLVCVACTTCLYPVTEAWIVCDSCRPCSHAERWHHSTAGQLGIGPDMSKKKMPTISILVTSISPLRRFYGCGGQGFQGWAQLWCTLANGTRHRWQSLILLCECDSVCTGHFPKVCITITSGP